MGTKRRLIRSITAVTSAALVTACGGFDPADSYDTGQTVGLGKAEQAVGGACLGTNDTNSLVASLAVAIASELGHWDVVSDFYVYNGKLTYMVTGETLCGGPGAVNCPLINALLRLQDDVSSTIPNHSPSHYRATLSSLYNKQKTQLTSLVDKMLNVDQGVFQIRNKNSGKLLAPQGGSTSSGALIQQSDLYNGNTASQWRFVLKGTKQQLKNIKSGLCLDLQTNTTATNTVQRACSTASTQGFRLAQQSAGSFWVKTATGTLAVAGASLSNGAAIQHQSMGSGTNSYFAVEPVGTEPHRDLLETSTAVYTLKVEHSGQYMSVSNNSLDDGVSIAQQPYIISDRRYHWYITSVGAVTNQGVPGQTVYQLINRRTGKCLDTTATAPYKMVQNTCSLAGTQRFLLVPTGDGTQVIYSAHGVTVGVSNGSTASGTQFVEGGSGWQPYNKLTLTPIIAGEPHDLRWSHSTNDGPCGQYDWFDITRPNGTPLKNPADTFVQLIFAGGKESMTGTDVNPYIAQQVSGNQVAIDPTYGLNEGATSTSGACTASCVKVSTTNIAGQCCSCNGVTRSFVRSAFNTSVYACQ